MSLKILLEDQIDKLFADNPELGTVKKNKFEIAVAAFSNVKHINGIEFDDLVDGIIGDDGDEGIDLCYVFSNGILINDEDFGINRESNIKAKFFQVKKEDGFSTDGFRKLKEGLEEIFNLELDIDKLQLIGANKSILEKAELIRKIFRKAMVERARFTCEVYYVTAAPEIKISEKIKILEQQLKDNVLKIPFEFDYWGAQKLLDLNQRQDELIEVKFDSQPLNISEKNIETSGYAGFVNGNKLMKTLIDEEGNFKSHLTEGNVRFFLGEDKKINSSIIDTASDKDKSSNFWAMNNGVTIIGDSITPLDAKGYSVSNPQIVNGCQTIHCLYYSYAKEEKNMLPESLKVFVKLVNSENPDTQTDIISATNSQNPVKSASLKANDYIQRNIESHLKDYDILYERRDNFYKRQGYTGNKVIGLLKMAQIVHTVVNKDSVVAVNDTTTLFDSETKYNSIFSDKADFDLYRYATILYQKIWSMKNSDIRTNDYPSDEKEMISKGGFAFLNIMSSLYFSDAEFTRNGTSILKPCYARISIDAPARKNQFTKRKTSIFKNLGNEELFSDYYEKAKTILWEASNKYVNDTKKTRISLFKNRGFDRDYIKPTIEEYFENK